MTSDRLAQIEQRIIEATPGPWEFFIDPAVQEWTVDLIGEDDDDSGTEIARGTANDDDALFIAHAREDVPWLVAELVSLRGQLEAATEPSRSQIEAAAKVLHDEDSLMDPKPHSYEQLSLPARIAYEDVAARVLRAAGGAR